MTERLRSGNTGWNMYPDSDDPEAVADAITSQPPMAKVGPANQWEFERPKPEPRRGPNGERLRLGSVPEAAEDEPMSREAAERIADQIQAGAGTIDMRKPHERWNDIVVKDR